MKIKIDGEDFTIKQGEWIITTAGSGHVIWTDDIYNTIRITCECNDCKSGSCQSQRILPHTTQHMKKCCKNPIYVKPEQVIKVGKTKDPLIEFLDSDLPEKALKEYSKDGVEKPRLSLIPQQAIVQVAHVMSYGAKKYDEYNFSKGARKTTYTDAAQRHINKYLLNEDVDVESGFSHLAHAISCLLMLLDNDLIKTSIDDRNKEYKK